MEEANFDFHLMNSSPFISSGVDSVEVKGIWYYAPKIDFERNPRSDSDMGAYENDLMTGYFCNNNAPKHSSYL